ncbi:hypothetical protein B484DRAFT_393887 [Ochromonadaceae sp. CCMP2298]|nr:hypothetical protein B484DRAFT_393887 [Ochromonadaceae sp. CCMP2298]|mmetsp:Transcript_23152/g.52407  ORF Transcript_23152/g.52407 Transcript_23152/m.52407 type:complete len:672 (+) Transcript_23152:183-2198(+)|eukprot:CAMPEP_0173345922 /NCGR_PEP_ID=MMETSP1144-20121109/12278_1 /TAXON_ID=483371 /ORGANISM="non described non described, Strain CCMP2298" /LENGTH=671 /DNA_ID=CAMNT_0014293173 /DNA_START=103 /DNA_END=2118 /DNA_ORIENTATION=+
MSLHVPSVVEDSWDADQRNFEMVERLEEVAKQRLPDALKGPFIVLTEQYSGMVRLPIFKMFEVLLWDPEKISEFYAVLTMLPSDIMTETVDLMESFEEAGLVQLLLRLFSLLRDFQVVEIVMQTSREDAHLLMQVLRHLPETEIPALCELVGRLSIGHVVAMLRKCDEPRAKACRLCKSKRMHSLEQHMLTGQVPEGLIRVVGVLPFYEQFQSWTACDETGFSFNVNTAEILWHKTPVDILQVCDKCLLEVNQALSNSGRFEELYHLDAATRKQRTGELREHEKGLAQIIRNISHERAHRRNREFALRALELQRFGVKREAQERDQRAAEQERQARIAAVLAEKNRIVAGALAVDKKWLRLDQQAEMQRLRQRQAYTELQQRLDFALPDCQRFGHPSLNVSAPKDRSNPRTWELAPINSAGQALLAAGASQIFGTYVPTVVNHDRELRELKEAADSKHASYLADKARAEAERAAARAHEIHMYNVHVREYFEQRELFQEWEHKEQLKNEQQRLDLRAQGREDKRLVRFNIYLEAERAHLLYEEKRSYKLRDYEWQLLHEQGEREDMFNEEMDQTEVDRFWGFDRFVQLQNREELRLRLLYEQKVAHLNGELVKVKAIHSFDAPNFKKIGSLPEDVQHEDNEMRRREAVLRRLKAEEVRGQLKTRLTPGYLS